MPFGLQTLEGTHFTLSSPSQPCSIIFEKVAVVFFIYLQVISWKWLLVVYIMELLHLLWIFLRKRMLLASVAACLLCLRSSESSCSSLVCGVLGRVMYHFWIFWWIGVCYYLRGMLPSQWWWWWGGGGGGGG